MLGLDSNEGTREFDSDSLDGVDVLVEEFRLWDDDIFVEGGD